MEFFSDRILFKLASIVLRVRISNLLVFDYDITIYYYTIINYSRTIYLAPPWDIFLHIVLRRDFSKYTRSTTTKE